jgi:kynurenine formamidase
VAENDPGSGEKPRNQKPSENAMKLPSRIIDLSSPLENETVYDPPFMRPKIAYRSNADTAPLLCELFPGLRREDLPDGEGWAMEEIQLNTHNGTHMDAPTNR